MPVFVRSRVRCVSIQEDHVRHLVKRLLSWVGEASSEISIELVGDRRMRRFNRDYRQHDRTTDVLAFACREAGEPSSFMLGDIVVSVPMAIRQAESFKHSLNEELVRLLIHGLLHLVGYDHNRGDQEARLMRRKEQLLWRRLVPVPTLARSRPS